MKIAISLFLLFTSVPVQADAESLFQDALQAARTGDYAGALDKFETALKANPNHLGYGSEYRQVIIKTKEYDRCVAFFEQLVTDHPDAANSHLNFGFAHVDKIPDAGSITQVLLANTALASFTKAVELEPSWIGYYTRGNSYLFWPRIFNRTQFGIDDLEKAVELQRSKPLRTYHHRAYTSLGDGYWKIDDLERARAAWGEGLKFFPDNDLLKARLSLQGDELAELIGADYDPNKRVNTDLKEVWKDQ